MIAVTAALLGASAVSLVFDSTRWLGVIGVALLFLLHPMLFAVLSIIAVVVAASVYHLQRRFQHALPSLDTRCD